MEKNHITRRKFLQASRRLKCILIQFHNHAEAEVQYWTIGKFAVSGLAESSFPFEILCHEPYQQRKKHIESW